MTTLIKSISQWLVLLMLSLFLAACSQPDNSDQPNTSATTSIDVPDLGVIDNPFNDGSDSGEGGGAGDGGTGDGGTGGGGSGDGGTGDGGTGDGGTGDGGTGDGGTGDGGAGNGGTGDGGTGDGGTGDGGSGDGGTGDGGTGDGGTETDACDTDLSSTDCIAYCEENFATDSDCAFVCNADPQYGFCETLCEQNDNNFLFCDAIESCDVNANQAKCPDLCLKDTLNPHDFCTDTCNFFPEHQYCIGEDPALFTLTLQAPKTLHFEWKKSAGLENETYAIEGKNGSLSVQTITGLDSTSMDIEIPIFEERWLKDVVYSLSVCPPGQSCEKIGSAEITQTNRMMAAIGYMKSTAGFGSGEQFGRTVAISPSGQHMAIATTRRVPDTSVKDGAVHLYSRRSNGIWVWDQIIRPNDTPKTKYFGFSMSFSEDGQYLAVGVPGTEITNVEDANNHFVGAGTVFLFTRKEVDDPTLGVRYEWPQLTELQPPELDTNVEFGYSVSFSKDAHYLAIGAPGEIKSATDNVRTGATYIYQMNYGNTDGNFAQSIARASFGDASFAAGSRFGSSVSLSGDGVRLAVSAPQADSENGAVLVYARSGDNTWDSPFIVNREGVLGHIQSTQFGSKISLSADGRTLAIGARNYNKTGAVVVLAVEENAGCTGVCNSWGDGRNTSTVPFQRLVAANAASGIGVIPDDKSQDFGFNLALNETGTRLAISAFRESDGAYGVNPEPLGQTLDNLYAGAVYIYDRDTSEANLWDEDKVYYLKSPNTEQGDEFGFGLSMSGDGKIVVVGAGNEDGGSTALMTSGEVAQDEENNSIPNSGAVYLY